MVIFMLNVTVLRIILKTILKTGMGITSRQTDGIRRDKKISCQFIWRIWWKQHGWKLDWVPWYYEYPVSICAFNDLDEYLASIRVFLRYAVLCNLSDNQFLKDNFALLIMGNPYYSRGLDTWKETIIWTKGKSWNQTGRKFLRIRNNF